MNEAAATPVLPEFSGDAQRANVLVRLQAGGDDHWLDRYPGVLDRRRYGGELLVLLAGGTDWEGNLATLGGVAARRRAEVLEARLVADTVTSLDAISTTGAATADRYGLTLVGCPAFGSGDHPSTRLMLQGLEELGTAGISGRRVLDVGCGSGILAMVAARLGATSVLAVDVEPAAVAAALANVRANHLDQVRVRHLALERLRGTYDLVLANLPGSVLCQGVACLQGRVRPGGRLLVAGFQAGQEEELGGRLGRRPGRRYREGPWLAHLY